MPKKKKHPGSFKISYKSDQFHITILWKTQIVIALRKIKVLSKNDEVGFFLALLYLKMMEVQWWLHQILCGTSWSVPQRSQACETMRMPTIPARISL